ncbi:MAG: cysteine--tRNA ligase [Dehalococcoidia bacterium]|nr:cysteine--tRNA ligase [Dehalococcoidia bacterium]
MRVHNTLSGAKEEFHARDNTVKMYVCGITPYAESHLGHAMSYIVFDTIRRYLEFRDYKVRHIQNFTDIDDKIIQRANNLGITPVDLAEGFTARFLEDMEKLNVKRADEYPRATREIPKILEIVRGLIDKGCAYHSNGDVYFRVAEDSDYGKLSHRSTEGMMAGARVEVSDSKEHPLDFALWKASKPGEPSWPSPWGEGRPGWHIECTAMALKYLGETLDIHGGGQDLIFPHHENEIAQAECYTDVKPFVRYWLHNGLMQLGEDKMSKSTGRLVTISEALAKFSPDALRLWVLSSHYRSSIVYSNDIVASMERGMERLRRAAEARSADRPHGPLDPLPYRQRFIEAMDDDFGTPQAVSALFDLARDINRAHDEWMDISAALGTLRELAGVLGLTLQTPSEPRGISLQSLVDLAKKYSVPDRLTAEDNGNRLNALVAALIDRRAELRRAKNWQVADQVREDLKELGITLEDTPQGTVWRYGKP